MCAGKKKGLAFDQYWTERGKKNGETAPEKKTRPSFVFLKAGILGKKSLPILQDVKLKDESFFPVPNQLPKKICAPPLQNSTNLHSAELILVWTPTKILPKSPFKNASPNMKSPTPL